LFGEWWVALEYSWQGVKIKLFILLLQID